MSTVLTTWILRIAPQVQNGHPCSCWWDRRCWSNTRRGTCPVGQAQSHRALQKGEWTQALVSSSIQTAKLLDKTPATAISGAEYAEADYDDIEGTAKMLDNNKVDTVISARAQRNLIAAADKSSTVYRFTPSEFVGYVPKGYVGPVLELI